MKTISTKTNPAFKRAQPLPILFKVPSAPTGGAVMGFSTFAPAKGGLRRTMTNLAVCAMGVSQGFNAPGVRLMS